MMLPDDRCIIVIIIIKLYNYLWHVTFVILCLFLWLLKIEFAFVFRLHEEIEDFFGYMRPLPEEQSMRQDIIKHLTQIVLELWPAAEVSAVPCSGLVLWVPDCCVPNGYIQQPIAWLKSLRSTCYRPGFCISLVELELFWIDFFWNWWIQNWGTNKEVLSPIKGSQLTLTINKKYRKRWSLCRILIVLAIITITIVTVVIVAMTIIIVVIVAITNNR